MRKMFRLGVLLFFTLIAGIFITSYVSADSLPVSQDWEDLNVTVSVASQTWVDISPDKIRWVSVNPGADSTTFTELEHSTSSHQGVVIRNIGSTGINTVWFNATYPSSLPYGTGTLTNYDTANFVLLSKADLDGNNSAQMASTDYYYINKKEYAEAERSFISASVYNTKYGRNIPFLQTVYPTSAANVTIGRLRDGPNEYFWALKEDVNGNCNASDLEGGDPDFFIGLLPHNETNIGDIDLDSGCDGSTCEEISSWETPNDHYYGFLDADSNRWKGTVVRLDTDCKGVLFITWNKDYALDTISTLTDGSANYWLANTTSTYSGSKFPQGTDLNGDLAPGEYYTAWVKLRLPWGIPAGTLDAGTITVHVSTGIPSR